MTGPIAYSGKKRVRDMEKSVLEQAYADACEPDDHVETCAPTNNRCPYRD